MPFNLIDRLKARSARWCLASALVFGQGGIHYKVSKRWPSPLRLYRLRTGRRTEVTPRASARSWHFTSTGRGASWHLMCRAKRRELGANGCQGSRGTTPGLLGGFKTGTRKIISFRFGSAVWGVWGPFWDDISQRRCPGMRHTTASRTVKSDHSLAQGGRIREEEVASIRRAEVNATARGGQPSEANGRRAGSCQGPRGDRRNPLLARLIAHIRFNNRGKLRASKRFYQSPPKGEVLGRRSRGISQARGGGEDADNRQSPRHVELACLSARS